FILVLVLVIEASGRIERGCAASPLEDEDDDARRILWLAYRGRPRFIAFPMPLEYEKLVKPELLSQPVYQPGKPIGEVARELGLDPLGIVKLASNENPLGPSPKALAAARRALEEVALYPDG